MNLGKRLYELQQLDLDLQKKTDMLSQVERQLSHNKALADAKSELEESQKRLAELQDKEKTVEWAVEDLQAKLKPLQQKLYAGSVKNPKELGSLQQQVTQLKSQVRGEEDKALEIMGQTDILQKEIAVKSTHVNKLEGEWQQTQKQLLSEQAELQAAIDTARNRRGELTSTIEPAHLQLYETVRSRKQGHAVAKIEQGRCQGCRINVPMSEITQARTGDIVQCSSCGRVLCVG